jgi:hypothetical protein
MMLGNAKPTPEDAGINPDNEESKNIHPPKKVFWIVTPCSVVVGYLCYGGL